MLGSIFGCKGEEVSETEENDIVVHFIIFTHHLEFTFCRFNQSI